MWLQISACLLAVSQLLAPALASTCPDYCHCITTRDGLHRATCSNLIELYKFSVRQKHHNINILDLSHNNITKLSHELDRLTELVTLDLSTNRITNINKFLRNSMKLVHLNLANNRIEKLSFTQLPTSISSLDLTHNLLTDVPDDLQHLAHLEHFQMEGNPLDCSCENIVARNKLIAAAVFIDDVKCATPTKLRGKSWLELKSKEICKVPITESFNLDMMMGDAPIDPALVGQDANDLKPTNLVANNDLEDGTIIHSPDVNEDDDSKLFLKVQSSTPLPLGDFEGSGEYESTTISDVDLKPTIQKSINAYLMAEEQILPVLEDHNTEIPIEGSGDDGSGFLPSYLGNEMDINEETTTEALVPLNPGPVQRLFDDDSNKSTTEFPLPEPPSVYRGGANWNSESSPPLTTERMVTSSTPRDTTVSEQIRVTQASEVSGQPSSTENAGPHKTGTYVCVAIIVVLLVGLIGFAIVKGQMRKRRDRRLLRQQKRDVEKASKEMVDMNKSLLGKPAAPEDLIEKKVNGKYELVPTHESHQKKGENGDVSNRNGTHEGNGLRTNSPRDTNQNKSSSKDNNLKNDVTPQQETSFESPASPNSHKDLNSLCSDDIFVPMGDDNNKKYSSNLGSDVSQPLINGDRPDSDYLSPSREYVPVYSPDMGRVRIKMAEIPKPKTPVLVTRSRSNAGDIIITPSDESPRKSTI